MERIIFLPPFDPRVAHTFDPLPTVLRAMNEFMWEHLFGAHQVLGKRNHAPVLTQRAQKETR